MGDGTLMLGWTRRARGAWLWQDGVDVPLVEETEAYLVTYGPTDTPLAQWMVNQPGLALAPADLIKLRSLLTGGALEVRQVGTYAQSNPLLLTHLT